MNEEKDASQNIFKQSSPPESFNPLKGLAGSASHIVQEAAAILEEEIAAGIVAAKQVEARVFKDDNVADGNGQLIQRFRKDAHDVVDIVLDLLKVSTNYLDRGGAKTAETTTPPDGCLTAASGKARPGGSATLTLELTNPGETAIETRLFVTDLISPSGRRISARNLELVPQQLSLQATEDKQLQIKIAIPASAKAGSYHGLIVGAGHPGYRTTFELEIV